MCSVITKLFGMLFNVFAELSARSVIFICLYVVYIQLVKCEQCGVWLLAMPFSYRSAINEISDGIYTVCLSVRLNGQQGESAR